MKPTTLASADKSIFFKNIICQGYWSRLKQTPAISWPYVLCIVNLTDGTQLKFLLSHLVIVWRFFEAVTILRTVEIEQGKGSSLEEAARKIGVTLQTVIRWRNEYGGLKVDQAKRLKELEQENARLKKLVANQALENLILKDVASGNF